MVSTTLVNESKKESSVHYWLIEPAKDPVREGHCRKCGTVKNFENYVGNRAKWNRYRQESEHIAA